ncbi:acetyl-CoA carboxylase biotin carboxyl carrier protein [Ochrobactrum sp. Q0168]|uniref:acetyl-CoA carboxylase biotin carboxyl carrier protein n=1 Tax=Ochrobactrum sp. Q0168 TaxID=2793241 RepID=UPI0018EA58A7|nr:acetyl-CoA carboxylase biotin carboxyl carrier protein [Ochrobactrum sp. Q0168]
MSLKSPDLNELRAIVDWVGVTEDLQEFSLKYGDVELFVSRNHNKAGLIYDDPDAVAAQAPAKAVTALPPVEPPVVPTSAKASTGIEVGVDEVVVKAPMVGTFYAAPKPGAAAFVAVGDAVEADTVLCIVEVMKLMNNIEAGIAGTVTRVLVENEQVVEYGQPMVVIKRRA